MLFLKGIVQVKCEHFLPYEVKELLFINLTTFLQKDIIQQILFHGDADDRDDDVRGYDDDHDHDVHDYDVYVKDAHLRFFLVYYVTIPIYDDHVYVHVHDDVHLYGHDAYRYVNQYECVIFHVHFVKLNSFNLHSILLIQLPAPIENVIYWFFLFLALH